MAVTLLQKGAVQLQLPTRSLINTQPDQRTAGVLRDRAVNAFQITALKVSLAST